MIFSEISKTVSPTLARQIYMKAKEYKDVIDFTIGDPDLTTSPLICEAAYRATLDGKTRYSPNAGIPELRDAISRHINKEYHFEYCNDNIAVTLGATEAIYLSLMALLNKDDEVIILAPYWIQYENMVKLMGGNPIIIDSFTQNFEPDLKTICAAITDKTKILILNSPNNPSGEVYSSEFMRKLAHLAGEKGIFILADEVYNTLVYSDSYASIARYCDRNLLILVNSFSKSYAMTGWRVGYVAAAEAIISQIVKLQQNVAVCAATPAQYAALEALRNHQYYSGLIREEFTRRRNVLIHALDQVPQISYRVPQGTFYVFLDISQSGLDSKTFAFSLLESMQVAVIPGIAFGEAFDNWIRLAFTMNEEKIIDGVDRIAKFIANLRK